MNEKLEKLNRELAKGEARLRRGPGEETIMGHQNNTPTREDGTQARDPTGALP